MAREGCGADEHSLRAEIERAEGRFAAGDPVGALDALEQVRCRAPLRTRVWAEAMADIAVILHSAGNLLDARAHARHARAAAPDLEEARETVEVCAASLGLPAETMPRADRILLVVDHFTPSCGGTELLAHDLALELTRLGHPVEVLCRPHPERMPGATPVPVHEAPPELFERALVSLLAAGRFTALIGISGPLGFPVLGLLRQPQLLAGVRSLVVPCVNEEFDGTLRASPDLLRDFGRMLFRVDAVGYSSYDGWDRRLLDDLGVPGVYLPNAVPRVEPSGSIRELIGASLETRVILHVANLWPQKNHLAFLDELRGAPGAWRLVCIGGPSEDHPGLAHQVAVAAARDPRVVLLGAGTRAEVAAAMREADLLVLPSIAEATPLVLLEAMSNGLPWLVSDTCESARDLAGGKIVARGAFAPAIAELLASPQARETLGRAGRTAYAAGYSWETVAPRYLAALGSPRDAALARAA
jgi:glycosyltransferase involved in cell wall biosynthesis